MSWELVWKVSFVAVLAIFSLMAILVTVLGARDISRLVRALREDQPEQNEHSAAGGRNQR